MAWGVRPAGKGGLGAGAAACSARSPKLVYGRMTGWGQDGPYAQAAGHDINYIALAGALHPIGKRGGPPIAPLNFVGDFGGGAMFLAFGPILLGAGLILSLAMSAAHAGAPAQRGVVRIANFEFAPRALIVAPGKTVTWVNGADDDTSGGADNQSLHRGHRATEDKK